MWGIPKSTQNEARAVSDLCCSAQQPWDAQIQDAQDAGLYPCTAAASSSLASPLPPRLIIKASV